MSMSNDMLVINKQVGSSTNSRDSMWAMKCCEGYKWHVQNWTIFQERIYGICSNWDQLLGLRILNTAWGGHVQTKIFIVGLESKDRRWNLCCAWCTNVDVGLCFEGYHTKL